MGDAAGTEHGQSLGKGRCPGQDRAVGPQLLLCLGDGHQHSGCGDGQQELLTLLRAARAWGGAASGQG